MDATVGYQAQQMQRSARLLGFSHSIAQHAVPKEIAVLNGLADAGQALVNNAA